jgi:uncharacterized protein YkwD
MKRALVTLLTVLAVAGGAAAGSNAAGEGAGLPELEAAILGELNAVRAERGLRPLLSSRGLQAAARSHSRAMLETGAFRHESADGTAFSDRIRRFYPSRGFRSWSVGENLLYSSGEPPAREAVAAWLDSPSHRRNMLSPSWREAGVGISLGAGASFVTVDFGTRGR